MSLSNYTSQAILNSLMGKTSNFGALASAPTVYVGLSSTQPNADGTNVTEPTGGSYARVATSASDWNSATLADPSVIDNAVELTFTAATADWLAGSNLQYGALYDAPTGGNFLGHGTLATAKPVTNGDQPKIPAGSLQVTLT